MHAFAPLLLPAALERRNRFFFFLEDVKPVRDFELCRFDLRNWKMDIIWKLTKMKCYKKLQICTRNGGDQRALNTVTYCCRNFAHMSKTKRCTFSPFPCPFSRNQRADTAARGPFTCGWCGASLWDPSVGGQPGVIMSLTDTLIERPLTPHHAAPRPSTLEVEVSRPATTVPHRM